MQCLVPSDLVSDRDREIYARGWRDRIARQTSLAGSTKSTRKATAARQNGRKGGKPKALQSYTEAILAIGRRNSGTLIQTDNTKYKYIE